MSKNAEETSRLASGDGLAAPESRQAENPKSLEEIAGLLRGVWVFIGEPTAADIVMDAVKALRGSAAAMGKAREAIAQAKPLTAIGLLDDAIAGKSASAEKLS
jgi:hypothetical protein